MARLSKKTYQQSSMGQGPRQSLLLMTLQLFGFIEVKDNIPNVARILDPRRLLKFLALVLQILPTRNMTIDIKVTVLFPIQSAVGIQKRFETPRAKTTQEIRGTSFPNSM